jgi:hypothetical protein
MSYVTISVLCLYHICSKHFETPISKITSTQRACKVAQTVEHLPSKYEVLSPTLCTTIKYFWKVRVVEFLCLDGLHLFFL